MPSDHLDAIRRKIRRVAAELRREPTAGNLQKLRRVVRSYFDALDIHMVLSWSAMLRAKEATPLAGPTDDLKRPKRTITPLLRAEKRKPPKRKQSA